MQRLAANQQREANHRASESDAQRENRLCGNRVRIATYRGSVRVVESQEQRENSRNDAARQQSTARQSFHDRQRSAIDQFRQNLYSGPLNPCYCCTRLCYNNGGLLLISMMSSSFMYMKGS